MKMIVFVIWFGSMQRRARPSSFCLLVLCLGRCTITYDSDSSRLGKKPEKNSPNFLYKVVQNLGPNISV